jgi:glucose/arabinose dehydrogenase
LVIWTEALNRLRAISLVLMMALVAGACVGDENSTATFDSESTSERQLPSITEPDVPLDSTTTPGESPATTETLAPLLGLGAELVSDGFDRPVFVTGAPGTDALFVVEQPGVISLVRDGVKADKPFLDLRSRVGSDRNEQGLLGLTFHPDYEVNGRFFAHWTNKSGDSRVGEFSATSPTVANPEPVQILLEQDQPASNHNGGMIAFGPDGLLYVALGDGGGNPENRSQDNTTLLGAILRLDVDRSAPYEIPEGNPFGNEIWVYGLRNPWRFSIDPLTENVYIGDVGQNRLEEIDVVSLNGAGTNFGWPQTEGASCFERDCDLAAFTGPVIEYPHPDGCSVTGGYVYRGSAIPELFGHYFYADFCGGLIRSFRLADGLAVDQFDWASDLAGLGQVASFGTDNEGELFSLDWNGRLYKLVPERG